MPKEASLPLGLLASARRHHKVKLRVAAVCECPLPYKRLTIEDVAAGARPYLLGGQPPNCTACTRHFNTSGTVSSEHHFCEFWTPDWQSGWGANVCSRWLQRALVADWLERQWHGPLTITPCDLWQFLGPTATSPGRTLWIIGDSQSSSLFEALKCFMHGFLTHAAMWVDPSETTPLNMTTASRKTRRFAKRLRATCRSLGPGSHSTGDEQGRLCFMRADQWRHHIRDTAFPLLRALGANRRDIMAINNGLHATARYRKDLKELVRIWRRRQKQLPFLIWRDTPTQHFDQLSGEWVGGKPPYNCTQIGGGYVNVTANHTLLRTYDGDDPEVQRVLSDIMANGWRNKWAEEMLGEADIVISRSYNETLPLWRHHRDNGEGYECTHYCAPSAPQVWLYGLIQTMRAYVEELNQHFGVVELTGIPEAEWPR